MRTTRSWLLIAGPVAVLLIAAGGAAFAVCAECQVLACRAFGPGTSFVQAPTAATSPEEVVRRYLAAVTERERRTMRLLSTPRFDAQQDALADGPYCNWQRVSDLDVDPPVPSAGGAESFDEVVSVGVRFRLSAHVPPGFPVAEDGRRDWGFLLGRDSAQAPWRVFGDGLAL